jgi:hypothetical protein
MAKKQINTYKFVPGTVVPDTDLYPNVRALLELNKKFIQEETIAFIQYNVDNEINPFIYYTYNAEKCRRDVSYVLEGYISDLRKGGNRQTVNNASKYFENGIPQIDGTRAPEVSAHTFIKNLIQNFILENVAFGFRQSLVSQVINNSYTAEPAGITKITDLADTIINVITNGLGSLPAIVSNRGYIKFPGFYKLKDILLITNATRNVILYNFADPTIGADLTYSENYDNDFPGALYGNEKITTLIFDIDTSAMMVTDAIQLFVEGKEQIVKFNSIATDAMERQKVGIPQSMLDADFEYGLQPTKWQAIALLRNYPSVYEIPGSDIAVTGVVTDASASTSNTGSSLITVTTANAHGLTVDSPFTIKALANSITGFSRAEGSFLVNTVINETTFTYYAKSKVGTTNPQTLSSTYTQLRKAAYYTGAGVGNPSFNIYSAGASGNITTSLITLVGSDVIGFTGTAPPVGAPLNGTGVTTGTQVTAVTGSGGTQASTTLISNASIGDTSLVVSSTTGISAGLVFDRGDGVAISVTDVIGNTVSLGGALTSSIIGTNQSYPNLLQTSTSGSGVNALFTVSRSGSSYITTVVSPGNSYVANDTITIAGLSLGGTTPLNNATITVTAASARNTIASLNSGTLTPGSGYSDSVNLATTVVGGGSGSGATVDITTSGGLITSAVINNAGSSYSVGDVLTIANTVGRALTISSSPIVRGSNYFSSSNVATTGGAGSGLTVDITAASLGGDVVTISVSNAGSGYTSGIATTPAGAGVVAVGAKIAGTGTYTAGTKATTGGTGTGLTLTITVTSGAVNTVVVAAAGTGYTVGDTITISGATAGTATTVSVAEINGNGLTLATTASGGGLTGVFINNPGTNYVIGQVIDVIQAGGSGGQITVLNANNGQITALSVNNGGAGYAVGNSITITGGHLIFPKFGNIDATFSILSISSTGSIQVASTNAGGLIQTVSTTGTPITAPSRNFISAVTLNAVTTSEIASGNTGISYSAISTIEVNFTTAHGFVPGNTITVQITSTGTNAQLAAGAYFVEQVPTSTSLRYTARTVGSIQNTLTGILYSRPDSFFLHRPFDGGVQLGTGGASHGAQAIRMSKKYIRYQSGKGVMYNTGALFAPSYDIRTITATGTVIGSVITINTDDTDHGCQVGAQVTIGGVLTSGYNGIYSISDIIDERTFSVIAYQTLGNTSPTLDSPCQMTVRQWHGATVRAGIFDDQNGMFYQYDGRQLSVVRRSSTFQVAGVVAIQANSNLMNGTNTRFSQQLTSGERIVIRGMTHIVTQVISDTQLTVAPDFRGVADVNNVKICKTIDLVVPQSEWNNDPCNGSGPSGYNIDIGKMQMIGIQHTWYGAGFIDFMLRGPDGNYVFAHRFRNSNVNTEAYMRTGNQPVRYEVLNEGARSRLSGSVDSSATILTLTDATFFPQAGTVLVNSEMIRYTGNTGFSLTGCTRGATLTQFVAGSQRTFTGGDATAQPAGSGVVLISNTITPIISHWGSAFMIDGQFDSDRGYIFNYAATGFSASVDRTTAFLIRLAPSVSNAQIGDLGERELLNRAQLLLSSIAVTSDGVILSGTAPSITSTPVVGGLVIEGVLNPSNYPTDPTKITWTSLQSAGAGGQPSFAQVASGGSVTWGGNVFTTTATIQGAFTTTLTAISFAPVTTTLTAIAFSAVTRTANAPAVQSFQNSTYQFAFTTVRNDFLIPQSTLNSINSQTPLAVNDTISVATFVTAGQRIQTITPNFITINAVVYARIVMTAVANANSATNTAVNNITFTSSVAAVYNTALSTARNDFLITQTQFASTTAAQSDVLSAVTFLTGNQTISSFTANFTTIAGVAYARVIMSAAASVSSTAGTGNNISITVTSANTARYGSAISSARNDFLITNTQASTSGIAVGDVLSLATFLTGGQTVQSITQSFVNISGTNYTRILMSANANSTSTSGSGNNQTVTVTAAGSGASYQNTNYLFFTGPSWVASGAGISTKVASDQTAFPAGTTVSAILARTFGATTVYRITFTQTTSGTLNAAGTLKFQFGAPYALPGEQVFSFVANPGESVSLDLSELKELTATALGGRGTFPNGPDVLAINVYKVAGVATPANVILRWGEAQA